MKWVLAAFVVLLAGCVSPQEQKTKLDSLKASCGEDWATLRRGMPASTMVRCFTYGKLGQYVHLEDETLTEDGSTVAYYRAHYGVYQDAFLIRVENGVVTSWTKWQEKPAGY